MDDEKRFTEAEVKAILGRAVELEKVGAPIPGVAGSLSLAELKQIGEEAGFNPVLVEAAAADFRLHGSSGMATWLGPSPRSRSTRLLPTKLATEDMEVLLRLLEDRVGRPGTVSDVLGRVTWVSQSAQLRTEVSLSQQGGTTRVEAEQRYPDRMRPLLHVLPAAAGFTLATALAAPAVITGGALLAIAVGGGVAGAAVGRSIWEMVARTTARKTERLADEIAAAAADLGRDPAPDGP